MNETFSIGGVLLVKLFGRALEEEARFRQRAASVLDEATSHLDSESESLIQDA